MAGGFWANLRDFGQRRIDVESFGEMFGAFRTNVVQFQPAGRQVGEVRGFLRKLPNRESFEFGANLRQIGQRRIDIESFGEMFSAFRTNAVVFQPAGR
jgi:hypothetical protein